MDQIFFSQPTPVLTELQKKHFSAKVLVKEGYDACHVWVGTLTGEYGEVKINYVRYLAHRVAWLIAFGEWPKGLLRHKCDVPRCVRIEHLSVGTHADNSRDMVQRGRSKRGQRWNNILTPDQKLEIKQSVGKLTTLQLAKKFGVSVSCIYKLISGQRN